MQTSTADLSHLRALELRLSNERIRLSAERNSKRRDLRFVWIAQIESEIASERMFLGMPATSSSATDDDELLAALAD